MNSDLKRIIVAAALAAAAFNATAPARHADASIAPVHVENADAGAHAPIRIADHRPSRIRIERCGEGDDEVHWGRLTEI